MSTQDGRDPGGIVHMCDSQIKMTLLILDKLTSGTILYHYENEVGEMLAHGIFAL
jgi:hypothetical protein